MITTIDAICDLARAAGRRAESFNDFASDDVVGDMYVALDGADMLDTTTTKRIESAFIEGRREYRLKSGCPTAWTTDPSSYDHTGFGTEEVERCEWNGKILRKVLMDPRHADYQCGRYMFAWDTDPRETERRIVETIARENAEREEAAQRRAAGLEWIKTADLDGDEDALDGVLREHGLMWSDVRAEQTRRVLAQITTEQATEWARCRATFADGVTIVDPGKDGRATQYGGWINGTGCAIYCGVHVVPHWEHTNSADDADVRDDIGELVGSLRQVANRIIANKLQIASPDEHLPPAPVMARLRPFRLTEVLRVEAGGRVVWVGRPKSEFTAIVVDDQGRLVRKRSILAAAEQAWREHRAAQYAATA